ncbi:MAG: 3-oxoacyl-[acyl-carrier-protein] reductase [Elusimicrobia bacterium RIFOXYC2_FULL_34_12]|nr:MAG: 3-oxoacyl-[acyl-carrier-protein] reductase [Elusimicrobia bacterium RIFOXYC2_FULL_34_12]OGS38047.1 MAG: 3-oxoacyl-[acyl-carrier-protein] reductase [Elusimicrobia bacterium RIFOXYD2_FULL_34_30]HAM39309.1 3-oxoacyl-ACP reductase [Elusimicrobiota bacterium]
MCEQKLKDKVALITGGAQGIGRAIADKLANEGAKIVIVDVMEDAAKKTAEEISKEKNVESLSLKIDVSSSQETDEMVKKTVEKFGKIDIIINNAGITRDNLLVRMSDEEWDKVIAINLKGVFNCSKAAAKVMMKQRSGKIVNIASVVGLMGNAGQVNYSASKGGVIALTKTLARELASRNINVNAVAPGFIKTAMTDKLSEEAKKKLTDIIPLNRLGEASDVANAVKFLCTEESSYITGEIISINGGMYM